MGPNTKIETPLLMQPTLSVQVSIISCPVLNSVPAHRYKLRNIQFLEWDQNQILLQQKIQNRTSYRAPLVRVKKKTITRTQNLCFRCSKAQIGAVLNHAQSLEQPRESFEGLDFEGLDLDTVFLVNFYAMTLCHSVCIRGSLTRWSLTWTRICTWTHWSEEAFVLWHANSCKHSNTHMHSLHLTVICL
jgi:hypothetical protein